MRWFPEALFVAKVNGVIWISDHYIAAEWRRDPWPEFGFAEGVYVRTHRRGHTYEKLPDRTVDSMRAFIKAAGSPPPSHEYQRDGSAQVIPPAIQPVQAFRPVNNPRRKTVHVDPKRIAELTHIIDGEPDEWRTTERAIGQEAYKPFAAVDTDGHVMGLVMPVRLLPRTT